MELNFAIPMPDKRLLSEIKAIAKSPAQDQSQQAKQIQRIAEISIELAKSCEAMGLMLKAISENVELKPKK